MSRHLGSVSELRRSRAYRSIARVALAGQLLTLLPAGATTVFAGQAPINPVAMAAGARAARAARAADEKLAELRLPPGALLSDALSGEMSTPRSAAPSFVSVPSTDDTAIGELLADYLIGAELRPAPHPNGTPGGPVTPAPEPNPVVVNRTVPNVAAPAPFAGFSSSPTDEEFLRGRIFEEALVPIGRATSMAENQALARALETYRHAAPDAIAPIDTFLQQYPDTPWRVSLLVNAGMRLRDAGAYTRALAMWDETWTLAGNTTDPHGRALADLALAEWLRLSMSLMRIDQVEARLAGIGRRDVRGLAGNRIRQVRERLAWWREHPEWFVPTELRALERLSSFERDKGGTVTSRSSRRPSPSSPRATASHGIDVKAPRRLGWLVGPAKKLGLTLRAMRRGAGAAFAAGTLVPMKNGQVLALLEPRGDRFLAYDPGLNRDLSVSRATLDEEASGVALMSSSSSAGATAPGWTEVAPAALPELISLCPPGTPDDHEPCPCSSGAGPGGGPPGSGGAGPSPPGMPTYRLHQSVAGVVIQDEPVTYSVPRGPAARISLSYGSRSDEDPAVFTFGNLGPKWRFDWRAYIQEHPLNCWSGTCIDPEVRVTLRGGGWESHAPLTGSWTTLGPHQRSHAIIVRTSSSPVQYERRLPDGSKEVYGVSDGAVSSARVFLTDLVDPQGQTVHLTYDAQFRLVSLTDAIGQVTTLSYAHATDPLKITKVTDPFGRYATFTYNSAGQLESITDAIGLTSTFAYGDSDFIVAMTTPYGTTTFREENITPRALEATDPLGGTERVEYWFEHASLPATVPAAEVPTGFTAANHEMNEYVSLYWDKRAMALQPRALASATVTKWLLRVGPDYLGGAPNTSIPYSIKRPLEGRVWYQYPNQLVVGDDLMGMGMQPSVTGRVLDDGSSQIWQATFNTLGHLTSQTDPLGRRSTYTYAPNGIDVQEVRQTTGSLNDLLATFSYNANHQTQTVTNAAGKTTTFTYNPNGLVLTATNPKNETTTYVYDATGTFLQTVSEPVAGATTSYTYDAYGRLRTSVDANGSMTTFDYDMIDRPTKITYADATYDRLVYDKLDVSESHDRLGRVSRYFYDALGRLTATRDPAGRTIKQEWCACGTLDAVTDGKGQKTSWEHDIQGRTTREIRADGVTSKVYSYEVSTGRLKTVTDAKQQIAAYAYNLDETVQSIVFTNAQVATPPVSYTYDTAYNRLLGMVDGLGTTTYTYHPVGVLGAGQVASVDGPVANDVIAYGYDELQRVTSRTVNGVVSAHTFDALGRVITETSPLGAFTFGYDGVSMRLASVLYPNGQSTDYAYDTTGIHRLQTIHHKRPGGATLSKFDYTYDVEGNISTWRQQIDNSPASISSFNYDGSGQLVRALKQTTDPSPTVLASYAYGYDPAGNRLYEQIDDAVIGWTYDQRNRLDMQVPGGQLRFAGTLSEPAIVTVGGQTAAVDAMNRFVASVPVTAGTNTVPISATDPNGNTAAATYEVDQAGSSRTFTYDANGNLTSDGTWTFQWDAANRLVGIVNGNVSHRFAYDGHSRRVRETKLVASVTVSDLQIVWCELRPCEERDAATGTVVRREGSLGEIRNGETLFYGRDHLGSVTEIVEASGTLRTRFEYDPFGRPTQTGSSVGDTTAWTGLRKIEGTPLVLAPMRAYHADLGRWLSEDPTGFVDGPNLYAYVGSNPVTFIDPSGLQAALPGSGGAGTAAGSQTCRPNPSPSSPSSGASGVGAAAGIILGAVLMVLTNPTNAGEGSEMPPSCDGGEPDLGVPKCTKRYRKTKRGCSCLTSCDIEVIPNQPTPPAQRPKTWPKRSNAVGTGNNCQEAEKNAERLAKSYFQMWTAGRPTGLKTKHCKTLWCMDK